jgi:hypothetical protein
LNGDSFLTRKSPSSVSQLVRLIRSTLSELGHSPSTAAVEALSFIVFGAMTGRSREYHGVGHVFAVASGLPPLGRLAAIYHDTVYQQVDHGFLPAIWDKIEDTGRVKDETCVTLSAKLREDAADVAAIFGFGPGQTVHIQDGLNEFLSAMLAVRELGPMIGRKSAWTIAACIEATIPFRGIDLKGRTPPERLKERIEKLAAQKREKISPIEITEVIRLAVRVANSDVQSFAHVDIGAFLDDTWKLLPESYPELHNSASYSIHSYCNALVKTEAFLRSLKPERIFQQHDGVPAARVYELLQIRAHNNLTKGCEYLRAKIVTVSLLEGLADLTGGDTPVSYFTGSAESGEIMAYTLLPEDEAVPEDGYPPIDPMVFHVLSYGRLREANMDTTKSPLSAHIYETLGTAGIQMHAERATLARSGKKSWEWYLDGFPPALVAEMVRAVAEIAVDRRTELLKLIDRKPRKARKAA